MILASPATRAALQVAPEFSTQLAVLLAFPEASQGARCSSYSLQYPIVLRVVEVYHLRLILFVQHVSDRTL